MEIVISPLERAIDRQREAVEICQQDTIQSLIRDGFIQRFEFTYEHCHKLLRRYLSASPGPPALVRQSG